MPTVHPDDHPDEVPADPPLTGRRSNADAWVFVPPVVAVVVATVWKVIAGWVPQGDMAAIQLRSLDVGGATTPLLGMPSTLSDVAGTETHHAGPAQFWLLAAPLRLVSWITDSPASVAIASATLAVGALVVVALCVGRSATSRLGTWSAAAFVSAAMLQALPSTAASPWNPDFGFVMLLAATTVAAVTMSVPPRLGPSIAAVVFASFAAHAHLGFVFVGVAVSLCVLTRLVTSPGVDRRRAGAIVSVSLAVVWLGPIIDAVTNAGGNVVALLSGSGGSGAGFWAGFDRFVHSVAPWRFGLQRTSPGEFFVIEASWSERAVGLAVVLSLVALVAFRPRVRGLAVLTLASNGAMIVSAALTPMTLATVTGAHLQRIWIVPSLLVWATSTAAVGFALVDRLAGRRPAILWADARLLQRCALALCATPMVVVVVAAFADGDATSSPLLDCSDAVTALVDDLQPVVGDISVYDSSAVAFDTIAVSAETSSGLHGELVRRGADLELIADTARGMYGSNRFDEAATGLRLVIDSAPVGTTPPGDALTSANCRSLDQAAQVSVSVRSGDD